MRLVRILIVPIVVLCTGAWTAPTQAEVPVGWPQAALLFQPGLAERDLRIVVGQYKRAGQGAIVHPRADQSGFQQ
ncbi:hypothetical protein WAE31_04790 (plasmid) [Xanthomonas axonopodis pv. vasculorum]